MATTRDKEHFFSIEGECDKRNKLLKSDARLTEEEVGRLDSGDLSIEDLERMFVKKAMIFRYRTQITVHAVFPREVAGRLFVALIVIIGIIVWMVTPRAKPPDDPATRR